MVDRAFMCELHRMAHRESIGRRYRRRPDTKVSWTMVGSLTHPVRRPGVTRYRPRAQAVVNSLACSRTLLPTIRIEECTMSEPKRIGKQLDQLVAERTREP